MKDGSIWTVRVTLCEHLGVEIFQSSQTRGGDGWYIPVDREKFVEFLESDTQNTFKEQATKNGPSLYVRFNTKAGKEWIVFEFCGTKYAINRAYFNKIFGV